MTRHVTATGALARALESVNPPRYQAAEIQAHVDDLTKPVGSLGRLEALAVQIGTIVGDPPPALRRAAVYVFAGDHGVTAQGVSAYPSAVTAQMCANFAAGGAAINAIAATVDAEVRVVDAGVAADLHGLDGLIDRKIRHGTDDLSVGPAMSMAEAERSLLVGFDLLDAEEAADLDIVGVGEMGIGNTTSAAAITSAMTSSDVTEVTGRGTGIDDDGLTTKQRVIRDALTRVPDDASPLGVLAEVGGFEIGAMAGAILGAAANEKIVVIDGYISTAAALIACGLCPDATGYVVASHRSVEPGHVRALGALGIAPLLDLDLRLGEGTGAALSMPLVRSAAAILRDMATFSSAGVSGPAAEPA